VRALLIALVLASPVLPAAAAQPGTAQNFLDRASRLVGKGPPALFDADYKRSRAEAVRAGNEFRLQREGTERAGRPILYCSPKPRAELGNMEFIRGLEAIPPAERIGMSLKDAMLRVLQRKYPCRR
jgi:hypothetical protein